MVSFNVVSLFTKVPVDDALQAIFTLLTPGQTNHHHSKLEPRASVCIIKRSYQLMFSSIHSKEIG